MDQARQAIAEFTSHKGHTTEVDELVHPGITNEVIKPHRHEEATQAINREVHQHHHHTTIQPISHTERLPERHTHNLLPVTKKEFIHGDPKEHESRLASIKAAFRDSSTTHDVTHSTSTAPQVIGEHVHHHVHEIVQPVIHKETIQPEVVHTTQPLHEIHHHHATHHGMSALPMKSLDEFKQAGGILTGSRSSTHETYDGEPRPYNKDLETTLEQVMPGHHGSSSMGNGSSYGRGQHGYTDSGVGGINSSSPTANRVGDNRMGDSRMGDSRVGDNRLSDNVGAGTTSSRPISSNAPNTPDSQQYGRTSNYGSPTSGAPLGGRTSHDSMGRTSMESGKKPSLLSRLNPLKDSDGDGKKGFND